MKDVEMGPAGPEEVSPIAELSDFELPADDDFTDRVRRSIDRREAASGFIYLSTHGFFTLLLDLLSTLSGIFHPPPAPDGSEKES